MATSGNQLSAALLVWELISERQNFGTTILAVIQIGTFLSLYGMKLTRIITSACKHRRLWQPIVLPFGYGS